MQQQRRNGPTIKCVVVIIIGILLSNINYRHHSHHRFSIVTSLVSSPQASSYHHRVGIPSASASSIIKIKPPTGDCKPFLLSSPSSSSRFQQQQHCTTTSLCMTSNNKNNNNNDQNKTDNNIDSSSSNELRRQQPQQQQQQKSRENTIRQGTTATPTLVRSILQRFTEPIIDDPALPLSDAVTAQIIGPGIQIAWLVAVGGPRPSWCTPFVASSQLFGNGIGSLLAPTLVHGAGLTFCWFLGALAAQAYRRDAISPKLLLYPNDDRSNQYIQQQQQQQQSSLQTKEWDYSIVLVRLFQAGSVAVGLLILATQLDILIENKFQYVQYGDSEEIDFRILLGTVEVMNDCFFEAITLATWRLYLAYQTQVLNP